MVKQSKMGESTEQNEGRGVGEEVGHFLAAAVFTRSFPPTPQKEEYILH